MRGKKLKRGEKVVQMPLTGSDRPKEIFSEMNTSVKKLSDVADIQETGHQFVF